MVCKNETSCRKALQVVSNGQIEIKPKMGKLYYNWLDNIRDWCISKTNLVGHRSAYYGPDNHIFVAKNDERLRVAFKHYGKEIELRQEEDVVSYCCQLYGLFYYGWPEKQKS